MRPLSQPKFDRHFRCSSKVLRRRLAQAIVFLFVVGAACGCSQSAATGGGLPPPQPPSIEISVTPQSENITLGNSQSFVATVTNTTNTSVSWSVNGVAGGNSVNGVIDPAGMYIAPADLPSPATIRITATSAADPTKSATANVTVISDISIQLTPNAAGVELGAVQVFTPAISSAGHPDTAVRWSLSGASCPNSCGSVDAGGNFTAPQILPAPALVTVSAQSVADPTKQASASITIGSHFTLTISAPASVPTGASAAIVATLTAVPGSNPSTAVSWTLSGTGCSGSGCGTLTTVTTQSAGSGKTASDSATYVAPAAAPTPDTVTITVTPQADPSKLAQATLAIAQGVGVTVTPGTATLAANHRATLTSQVNGAANANVLWSVNGVPGGNAIVGLICVAGSNPCRQVLSPSAAAIDYLAPGAIPSPDPVTVQAVSAADSTKNATAQITVINHVVVSVFPGSATLPPLGVQSFSASVLGSGNQGVIWQISGTPCGPGGGACGTIDANGTYTAPPTAPSPDALQIVAVSQDDTAQSGTSSVTISTGVNISALHPASVYAGGLQGFTLRVDGSGFVLPGATAGSTIWIAGTLRTTTCISGAECFAPVSAADLLLAGTDSVQIRNPDGTQSNAVNLVVAAPNISDGIVSLTAGAPAVGDQNIVVVEPTTAGVSSPNDDVDLDVAALGAFSTATNSCTLAGNPVSLSRPANGSITADVCLFSQSGLDASMTVTVSGPGDVTVISKQPAGLGILHITLLIPAAASAGARTLFIQTTNLDKTAATGSVQLQ